MVVFCFSFPVRPRPPQRARKDALLDRFVTAGRFPFEPVAVFESRKSPLAFLLLSATPIVACWLIYHGIVDVLAIMAEGAGDGSVASAAAAASRGSTSL